MESNHPVLPGSADRRSSEGMDFMHAATENTGHLLFIFLYDSLVPIRQKFNGAARGYFHLLSHLDGNTHPAVVILHFVLSLCLLGWHLCSQEVGTLTISGTFSRSSTTYPSALKRPDPGGVPVPSLHRLPQNPERRGLREQGGGELIRGAFLALPSAGVGSETVTNQ